MHVLAMTQGRYSSHMIQEVLKHLRLRHVDHTVAVPGSLVVQVQGNQVKVVDKTGKLIKPDIVLNAGASELDAEIVDYFEVKGVPVVNPVRACRIAKSKPQTTILLACAGIRQPDAVMVHRWSTGVSKLLSDTVGVPCVAKPRTGSQGVGVNAYVEWVDVENRYRKRPQSVYIQSYVPNKGFSYRLYVIEDKVVAAHYYNLRSDLNISTEKESRNGQRCTVTPELTDIAVRATTTVGLNFAALDIIESPRGFEIIEINGWPNGSDADRICEISIGELLVDYMVKRVVASGVTAKSNGMTSRRPVLEKYENGYPTKKLSDNHERSKSGAQAVISRSEVQIKERPCGLPIHV